MPPATSAQSTPASLQDRLVRLASTLQFAWFVGHFTLLLAVGRYSLSYVTFNAGSSWAAFSYRLAFISAVATYGIVVYKAYRARIKPGANPQQVAVLLLGDENVQYLLISLVWLFSRQIPLALLPFAVYSVFHVATYTRTNLIPTITPPKAVAGASPGAPAKSQSPLANTIGKFVKDYYDSSMFLVAALEIGLWFRLLLSGLTFSKGALSLLVFYTVFLRARVHQSQFVQNAFSHISARVDQQVQQPNVSPAVKNGWQTFKHGVQAAADLTDIRRYIGGPANAQKKPQ